MNNDTDSDTWLDGYEMQSGKDARESSDYPDGNPKIFPQDDITLLLGVEQDKINTSISWLVIDDNPDNYTIYFNETIMSTGNWYSGEMIVYNLSMSK